jgi:CRISPR-associated protein Csb3
MTYPAPSFSVNVDVTNPGQFFACCGLLELAHRLWPGAEGWFSTSESMFVISCEDALATLEHLTGRLSKCDISGLSEEERKERETLEAESRELKQQNKKLPSDKEERRKELGILAREGMIRLGKPFNVVLDWWQTDDNDTATPKTWAGRQELHKIARAAQDALSNITELRDLLNYGCVMRTPQEYRKKDSDDEKRVEPFYFDARRFAHALDAGFSLDVQEAETIAHPVVELLSLIGLQRFRPASTSNKWALTYSVWSMPLSVSVASAATCGALPVGQHYRFQLQFRDDQKRYKAFDFATPTGDQQ